MIRKFFKVIIVEGSRQVVEVVEYLNSGKVVERTLDKYGVPTDIKVIKEGKS